MAENKPKKTKVSLTLRRLLLEEGEAYLREGGALYTGEVVEAMKAEAAGFIVITSYRDDKWQETTTRPEKWVCCFYHLTPAGLTLKEKLRSGEVAAGQELTDPELIWLLQQAANLRYEGQEEPPPNYDEEKELQLLANYAYGLLRVGRRRLGLEGEGGDKLYISDRIFGGVLSEVMTAPRGMQLRVALVEGGRDVRDLVSLNVRMEARGDSRYIFKRALEDYPRAAASILKYGSAVKFGCHVAYANEPRRRAPTIDHVKAYFAADDDEEETCWLEFDASHRTTRQTIHNAATALYAFYEAAKFRDTSEAILRFHTAIQSRRQVRRAESAG